MNIKSIIVILTIASAIASATSNKGVTPRPTNITRLTEPTNVSSPYAPLTLNHEWPAVGRLILSVTGAVLGTLLNTFFISSFCCEDSLSTKGNVFLACIGLTDLIITGGVIPVPAILILSGQWDTAYLCTIVQAITEASTYSFSLFMMLVGIETYIRLCRPLIMYCKFISWPFGTIACLIFLFCASVAATGVYLELDYDYCLRQHTGNYNYRVATTVVFHLIPILVALKCLFLAYSSINRRAYLQITYRRSQQYNLDLNTTCLNFATLCFYLTMWLPHNLIAFFFMENVNDGTYYIFAWLGISRSVVSTILYACIHKTIRKTFGHLCNYCCCKNNIPSPLRNHHGRITRSTDDVPMYEMHSLSHRTYHSYYESRDSSLMATVEL